ncbi:glycoside hydrolase family 17 protein [Curvularia clavata]|uniref:glucan endo-1,3-beta-D-glucosidase n=1 Tax=Curvularia clavata TaxID=95742 RepID=A0A9Q8Z935_CURCL|nr:glycoside hydrolase family 17 protein [Curvularia clavata]
MKRFLIISLFLLSSVAQPPSKIYTGFNYGAFWTVEANVKKKADFLDGFSLAKSLNADIPFDSARLFTCKAAGTLNEPTEAFDAAVESNTNLLLGFWITPGKKGDSPDENVKNEMAALEKGFKKHGQALSDLIIGLAVGSEDIYRAEEAGELGVTAQVVGQTIAQVKESIAESSFAEYMKDKPIGHVDTAKYAVVDNADFIGMTAYPYWNKDSINMANTSFHLSLEDVKNRAGNRPVWIAEMGWPSTDTEQHGSAVAGVDELQRFWNEVGCSVFGKYTTFWYELLRDSALDQKADWGLVDVSTRKPRIKNLSCAMSNQSLPALPLNSSQSMSQPALPSSSGLHGFKAPSRSNIPSMTLASFSQPAPETLQDDFSKIGPSTSYLTVTRTTTTVSPRTTPSTPNLLNKTSFVTVVVTKTSTKLVDAQPPLTTPVPSRPFSTPEPTSTTITENTAYCENPTTTPLPTPTMITTLANWCVTVADIYRNGHPVIVAGGPAAPNGECHPPPTFTGLPYAPTEGSVAPKTPSSVPTGRSWCIAMADIDGNGQMVPVDAGPAGLDGECDNFSVFNGVSATTMATHVSLISSSFEQASLVDGFGR